MPHRGRKQKYRGSLPSPIFWRRDPSFHQQGPLEQDTFCVRTASPACVGGVHTHPPHGLRQNRAGQETVQTAPALDYSFTLEPWAHHRSDTDPEDRPFCLPRLPLTLHDKPCPIIWGTPPLLFPH